MNRAQRRAASLSTLEVDGMEYVRGITHGLVSGALSGPGAIAKVAAAIEDNRLSTQDVAKLVVSSCGYAGLLIDRLATACDLSVPVVIGQLIEQEATHG